MPSQVGHRRWSGLDLRQQPLQSRNWPAANDDARMLSTRASLVTAEQRSLIRVDQNVNSVTAPWPMFVVLKKIASV